jgi:hypothetical protein
MLKAYNKIMCTLYIEEFGKSDIFINDIFDNFHLTTIIKYVKCQPY